MKISSAALGIEPPDWVTGKTPDAGAEVPTAAPAEPATPPAAPPAASSGACTIGAARVGTARGALALVALAVAYRSSRRRRRD